MIAQIISHTPTWVFVLFAALLVVGFKQTRNRTVREWPAYLLPVGMVALSFFGVQSSFGLGLLPVAAWLACIVAVALLGYRRLVNGMRYLPAEKSFLIPGSWIPFAVIMAIFLAKYLFAVLRATGAIVTTSSATALLFSAVYGCLSGYFCARAGALVATKRAHLAGSTGSRPVSHV